jgi:hypothetical protein
VRAPRWLLNCPHLPRPPRPMDRQQMGDGSRDLAATGGSFAEGCVLLSSPHKGILRVARSRPADIFAIPLLVNSRAIEVLIIAIWSTLDLQKTGRSSAVSFPPAVRAGSDIVPQNKNPTVRSLLAVGF